MVGGFQTKRARGRRVNSNRVTTTRVHRPTIMLTTVTQLESSLFVSVESVGVRINRASAQPLSRVSDQSGFRSVQLGLKISRGSDQSGRNRTVVPTGGLKWDGPNSVPKGETTDGQEAKHVSGLGETKCFSLFGTKACLCLGALS